MYVLAIDTSSPAVTAGIVLLDTTGTTTVAVRAPLAARGHGELLSPAIAECLADAGLVPADLDAVVAGVGPGPYTGLRVGLVTAAAFADAAGLPAYGVCSLDAIAHAAADEPDLLVASDARRREVYWARYEYGRRVTGPAVDLPGDLDPAGATAIAGTGGELYADAWPGLPRRAERYPSPTALVESAGDRLLGDAGSETLEPMYLRRPDAVVPGTPKAVRQ